MSTSNTYKDIQILVTANEIFLLLHDMLTSNPHIDHKKNAFDYFIKYLKNPESINYNEDINNIIQQIVEQFENDDKKYDFNHKYKKKNKILRYTLELLIDSLDKNKQGINSNSLELDRINFSNE
jgi:hypothetical protein